MTNVPGYFARNLDKTDARSHLYSFEYDSEFELFRIGGSSIDQKDFDPYTFSSAQYDIEPDEVIISDMPTTPLMIPVMGGPIAGPILHEWVKNNSVGDIAKLMHRVFSSFYEDPAEIPDGPGGHMGFDAWEKEDGDVRLQVLGDCACLEADPQSMFIDNRIENGYAQYGLHNAETQAQRVGLYAGLGHFARLAGGRPLAQGSLF